MGEKRGKTINKTSRSETSTRNNDDSDGQYQWKCRGLCKKQQSAACWAVVEEKRRENNNHQKQRFNNNSSDRQLQWQKRTKLNFPPSMLILFGGSICHLIFFSCFVFLFCWIHQNLLFLPSRYYSFSLSCLKKYHDNFLNLKPKSFEQKIKTLLYFRLKVFICSLYLHIIQTFCYFLLSLKF